MEIVKLLAASSFLIWHISTGLEIASKVNFEKTGSSETTESDLEIGESESLESIESTTRGTRRRNKIKKTDRLIQENYEARIPISFRHPDKQLELVIPAKLESKKQQPKNKVKFYKGTRTDNDTAISTSTTTTTESAEEATAAGSIPVVKGSFSDVKPDFLVSIPRETVPRDIHSISPLSDFRNYFSRLSNVVRPGNPEHVEGLRPPPPRGYALPGRGDRNRNDCGNSYSGTCYSTIDGNYPNVGPEPPPSHYPPPSQYPPSSQYPPPTQYPPSSQYPPRPVYGVPDSGGGSWNRPDGWSNNDWNSQRPNVWGSQQGQGSWNQNQGHTWNGQNQEKPAYGPPNDMDVRPWTPMTNYWNSHGSRPNDLRPIRQNFGRGKWVSCKPFEITSGREAPATDFSRCPQNVPVRFDPVSVTPASKIDDKTLFDEEGTKSTVPDDDSIDSKAKLVFYNSRRA